MLRQMSHAEIGEQLGVTAKRVFQYESRALAKMTALWMGDELDQGLIRDERELRLLIAHCKNALREQPLHPRRVEV